MRLFTAAVLLLALAFNARAEDDKKDKGKIDRSKLVGTWKLTRTDSEKQPPKDATIKIEFTKDGKVNVAYSIKDKELGKLSGTYKVEGDKLTTTMKDPQDDKDKKDTVTIKELTDKKFVTTEMKGDKIETTEFEKSK